MQKKDKHINNDPFIEVIKEKLEGYSIQPDDSLWDEIESQLDSKKRINLVPWISAAAVAACIALLWLIIPFNNPNNTHYHENEQFSENESPAIPDIPEAAISEPAGRSVQESLFIASVKEEKRESPIRFSAGAWDEIIATEQSDYPHTPGVENVPYPIDDSETNKEESVEKKEKLSQEEAERLLFAMTNRETEPLSLKTKKRKAAFGLSIGSGNNYVADNNNPLLADGNWNLLAEGPPIQKASSQVIQDKIYTPKDFESETYNAPLSFGLSVRYPLSDRFALETGITYTYLSTNFDNKSPKRDAKLKLHYLGIPVNAVANIYETGKWNFYVSAGGEIEKGIYSYYEQNTYGEEGDKNKTVSPNKKIDGIQLSAHISPGVEFKFDKNYSVYLEPTVVYYFDNNQPVSIRTKNPLKVGINAGLRFNL